MSADRRNTQIYGGISRVIASGVCYLSFQAYLRQTLGRNAAESA